MVLISHLSIAESTVYVQVYIITQKYALLRSVTLTAEEKYVGISVILRPSGAPKYGHPECPPPSRPCPGLHSYVATWGRAALGRCCKLSAFQSAPSPVCTVTQSCTKSWGHFAMEWVSLHWKQPGCRARWVLCKGLAPLQTTQLGSLCTAL